MKDIVIAGIAGSGKWTQARELRSHLWDKVQYFEPGSIYRALASNDNIIGNYTKSFTSIGKLVPDTAKRAIIDLVFACLDKWNILLVDGFPRMLSQKKMFDEAMQRTDRDFMVFELVVSEQEAIQRLEHRTLCPSCGATYSDLIHGAIDHCPDDNSILQRRGDDSSPDAIKERFRLFYQDTQPCLKDYKKEWKLVQIDGTQSIEAITQEIISYL